MLDKLEQPGQAQQVSCNVPIHHRDTRSLDEEPLAAPEVVALVGRPGEREGIIHRLRGVDPADVSLGLEVEPVWSKERTGAIADMSHIRSAGPD